MKKFTFKPFGAFIENTFARSEEPINDYEKTHLQTKCEVVTEDEIYLLEENPDYDPTILSSKPFIRKGRICGAWRTKERRLRCLCPAGFKTNHPGYGQCKFHERRRAGISTNIRVLQGYQKKGLAFSLKELEEKLPKVVADAELYVVKDEILVLEELLKYLLNSVPPDSKEIRKVTMSLAKVKEIGNKIKTDKLLIDISTIRLFVGAIFDVLRHRLGPSQYSTIASDIKEKISFPVNKSIQEAILKDTEDVGYSIENVDDSKNTSLTNTN